LQIYDQQVKGIEEKSKWGWLTLYLLLKQYPLQTGLQCPWEHTKEELESIIEKLENE
jgi:hypothetical protein